MSARMSQGHIKRLNATTCSVAKNLTGSLWQWLLTIKCNGTKHPPNTVCQPATHHLPSLLHPNPPHPSPPSPALPSALSLTRCPVTPHRLLPPLPHPPPQTSPSQPAPALTREPPWQQLLIIDFMGTSFGSTARISAVGASNTGFTRTKYRLSLLNGSRNSSTGSPTLQLLTHGARGGHRSTGQRG